MLNDNVLSQGDFEDINLEGTNTIFNRGHQDDMNSKRQYTIEEVVSKEETMS